MTFDPKVLENIPDNSDLEKLKELLQKEDPGLKVLAANELEGRPFIGIDPGLERDRTVIVLISPTSTEMRLLAHYAQERQTRAGIPVESVDELIKKLHEPEPILELAKLQKMLHKNPDPPKRIRGRNPWCVATKGKKKY